jgi:hypothetical protein
MRIIHIFAQHLIKSHHIDFQIDLGKLNMLIIRKQLVNIVLTLKI